jgi:hypothetical protein
MTLLFQHQAVKVLSELLGRATSEELPVIAWRISSAANESILTGECDAVDPIQRRADFDRWREALGAEEWPGGISHGGTVRLSASLQDTYHEVTITLSATITSDEMH